MVEDIKLIGLKEELIEQIFNELGYDTILSMACNYKKIKENIHIFQSVGIDNVDEVLLNKNELFFKEPNLIIEKLSKIDIPSFVCSVKDDYNMIDDLFDN